MAVSADRSSFARQLVAWQARHGRHGLPWQARPLEPYRVWVSEIMLQQTQVQTVIPYFERFMQRFPSLASLARADESEVLSLWSGLGYYRRAKHLHACARQVVAQHGGRFPSTAEELAKLPGIGPSTAAAIASLVFGQQVAILDGNVKRVLARLTCTNAPWASPELESSLRTHARALLPDDSACMPAYTQAMMDLGATICRHRDPLCENCPVSDHCLAHAQGQVHRYPRPRRARILARQQLYWAVLKNDCGVWLIQQSDRGIWPGLWLPWTLDLRRQPRHWKSTVRHLREVVPLRCTLTHRRLEIDAGIFEWPASRRRAPSASAALGEASKVLSACAPPGAPDGLRYFSWDQAFELPLPAPVRKLLLRLCPFATASDGARRRSSRS